MRVCVCVSHAATFCCSFFFLSLLNRMMWSSWVFDFDNKIGTHSDPFRFINYGVVCFACGCTVHVNYTHTHTQSKRWHCYLQSRTVIINGAEMIVCCSMLLLLLCLVLAVCVPLFSMLLIEANICLVTKFIFTVLLYDVWSITMLISNYRGQLSGLVEVQACWASHDLCCQNPLGNIPLVDEMFTGDKQKNPGNLRFLFSECVSVQMWHHPEKAHQ